MQKTSQSSLTLRSKFLTGFTLIEILIVVSLITLFGGFSVIVGMDFYQGYAFRADVNILVAALQKARSQALSNRSQTSHGVHIAPGGYTLFEGTRFDPEAPTNLFIPAQPGISRAGAVDIMFAPLSATASPSTTITVSDGSLRSRTVSVNTEGRINW